MADVSGLRETKAAFLSNHLLETIMHRRSFLVGLGAILTAPYVEKVQTALAHQTAPSPLIAEADASRTLLAVPSERGFVLTFPDNGMDLPALTYREMLDEFHNTYFPKGFQLTEEEIEDLEWQWGITPEELDDEAPVVDYEEAWYLKYNPQVEAYRFLEALDLGPIDAEGEDLAGNLLFIEGDRPGSNYIAVEAPDELTLHLLQARLLELGQDICVEIERT